MGAVMSFTKVTSDELKWAEDNPADVEDFVLGREREEAVDGYLDKGWRDLQELFDAADVDIELRDDGDFIDEEGVYFAWSSGLVAATAALLREATFERLRAHLDPEAAADESALAYVEGCYATLRAFFADAADSGSAAIMTFSY
ncbi:DUF1877 family protein [Glycomyces paridis]|uniref:DUF1877 family protein n=1 Tax=Glycomyces paridis TaxID=2126555 RepID=A0A4S8P914_9ACTN|nr:DUF1877 family protein [Glycomyces paridis]THV26717.1 DUF1877 family protein [Glycomyces paridis]